MQTAMTSTFMGVKPMVARPCKASAARRSVAVRAGQYDEELMQTAVILLAIAILAAERTVRVAYHPLIAAQFPGMSQWCMDPSGGNLPKNICYSCIM